jgi:hypothetical protein
MDLNYTELQEFKVCCNNLLSHLNKPNDEDNNIRLHSILNKYPQVKLNNVINKILNNKNPNINKLEIITNYLFFKTTYRKLDEDINVYNIKNLQNILNRILNKNLNNPLKQFIKFRNISDMYIIPISTILFSFIKDLSFEIITQENFLDFLRYFNDEDLTKTFTNYCELHNIDLYNVFNILIENNVMCNL